MSRWLPDRLDITLTADRVVVRGGRQPLVDEAIDFPEPTGGPVWESACGALESVLSSRVKGGACRLHIVLSARFYQAVSVPWQADLYTEADRMQYAMHRFKKLYGSEIADGEIRLGAAAYGTPVLAVAIERPLLEKLRGLAQSAGCRIVSIEPVLTAVFDRHRAAMRGARCFAFAVVEPGMLSVALVKNGAWHCVAQGRAKIASISELRTVLRRELHGFDSPDMPSALYYSAPHLDGALELGIEELSSIRLNALPASSLKRTAAVGEAKHAA